MFLQMTCGDLWQLVWILPAGNNTRNVYIRTCFSRAAAAAPG